MSDWVPGGWDLDNENGVTGISDNGLVVGTARIGEADGGEALQGFLLVPASLVADVNRDGTLAPPAVGAPVLASSANPLRIWINDDDDAGDTRGTDLPDGFNPRANFQDTFINGTRDLVDFSPVFLDVRELLTILPPGGSTRYTLRHEDGALNFAYTDLTRERAFAVHTEILTAGFGEQFDRSPSVAPTHHVTPEGVDLSPTFLEGVRDDGLGVLLVEGRTATSAPLVLAVERDGATVAEVRLELRINPVEAMFRHINLRSVAATYDGRPVLSRSPGPPTRMGDPGDPLPDAVSNGKYFIFVHGYKVDDQAARGWASEIFKRLHVLGSRARFVGVSWHGSTGLDYHKAVFQAFQTGDALEAALGLPPAADITVAAHSLGNVVVSHAIQNGGFSPARYFMINAAVPLEAFDRAAADEAQRAAMTEDGWRQRPERFFAANWHQLFSGEPADQRNRLTWKDRFQAVLPRIVNFYSPGEDVVENSAFTSASVVTSILRQGFNFSRGSWKAQELVKGVNWTRSIADVFMERGQAGWDRDLWYLGVPAADIRDEELRIRPFFDEFVESDLIDPDPAIASAMAGEKRVQYDLLARALPAMSFAAAANALPDSVGDRDFNLEASGRAPGQWPSEGHTGDPKAEGRWLHSDFKAVALPYVHRMFDGMIARGGLR